MEKKIERVPYISKWYKEEQKNELLNFAFDEQNAGSDFDVDKIYIDWLNKDTTTISYPNGINFWSPQKSQLKYVCNLTQEDVDNIDNYIKDIYHKVGDCQRTRTLYKINEICDLTCAIQKYIENIDGIRDKKQRQQLERLEKQSKPKKSYEGTLGEHWKELSELFYIKSNFEHWEKLFNDVIIPDLKLYGHVCPRTEFNIYYYKRVDDIYNSLGIDFIKDFIKACEKCEE